MQVISNKFETPRQQNSHPPENDENMSAPPLKMAVKPQGRLKAICLFDSCLHRLQSASMD